MNRTAWMALLALLGVACGQSHDNDDGGEAPIRCRRGIGAVRHAGGAGRGVDGAGGGHGGECQGKERDGCRDAARDTPLSGGNHQRNSVRAKRSRGPDRSKPRHETGKTQLRLAEGRGYAGLERQP